MTLGTAILLLPQNPWRHPCAAKAHTAHCATVGGRWVAQPACDAWDDPLDWNLLCADAGADNVGQPATPPGSGRSPTSHRVITQLYSLHSAPGALLSRSPPALSWCMPGVHRAGSACSLCMPGVPRAGSACTKVSQPGRHGVSQATSCHAAGFTGGSASLCLPGCRPAGKPVGHLRSLSWSQQAAYDASLGRRGAHSSLRRGPPPRQRQPSQRRRGRPRACQVQTGARRLPRRSRRRPPCRR